MTYGDGLSNVDITSLQFHQSHGKEATLTAVNPLGRFGSLRFNGDSVTSFHEKPDGDGSRVNGGFSSKVLNRIKGDDCVWEHELLSLCMIIN